MQQQAVKTGPKDPEQEIDGDSTPDNILGHMSLGKDLTDHGPNRYKQENGIATQTNSE